MYYYCYYCYGYYINNQTKKIRLLNYNKAANKSLVKKDSLDISFINNFSINYTTTTINYINTVMVFLMLNLPLPFMT